MDNQNDKKMRKLLLVLFISNICYSQSEVVSLSIEDAVKYGIENNRNLKNAGERNTNGISGKVENYRNRTA